MICCLTVLALGMNFQGDPAQELRDIVAKSQKVQSYAFAVESNSSGGVGGPELEHSGSFSLTVSAEGVITDFDFETSSRGNFREREIEMKRSSMVAISGINQTEVDVPEEAAAALAQEPDQEEEIF